MWIFKHWTFSEENLTVHRLSNYDETLSYLHDIRDGVTEK